MPEVQVEWFDEHNQKRSGTQPVHRVGPSISLMDSCKGIEGAQKFVTKVMKGLQSQEPELAEEGEGGAYFLKSKNGKRIAVFKPFDEQPHCENNPKMKDSPLLLPEAFQGIKMDEAPKNEVAAFLLDRQGFADVPFTVLAECTHHVFSRTKQNSKDSSDSLAMKKSEVDPTVGAQDGRVYVTKFGSLQKYIDFQFQSWDMGASRYATREVHRIGILDLRILNLDRHGGNILVVHQGQTKGKLKKSCEEFLMSDEDEDDRVSGSALYHLVPIDHAFSLPACVYGTDLWFEWLSWPQSEQPFGEETIHYIDEINIEEDAKLLRSIEIRKECIQTMILTTTLLKVGALKYKMTLSQIASFIRREDPVKPSRLEKLQLHALEEYSRFEESKVKVSEEQELKQYVAATLKAVEAHLPSLMNPTTPKGHRLRRNSSISNELYLTKMVDHQLKLNESPE